MGRRALHGEYRAFPAEPDRNARQQRLEVPLFVRCLGLRDRRRILEVGCGAGVALPVLHSLCAPDLLVGVDIDAAALRSAAARTASISSRIELIRADVRMLPLPDASFDAVVDFGTCYHIARPDDALAEIARVLCPAGIFATETKLSQILSHPIRSYGRNLTVHTAPWLRPARHCGLWRSFTRTA
jgi:ubiquinone/menaquinone biosynthesis C-methylase UbiE